MPAKNQIPPAVESEDAPEFRFRVTSDRFVDGKRNAVVTRAADDATAALVEAGHLEPMSQKAAAAVEPDES